MGAKMQDSAMRVDIRQAGDGWATVTCRGDLSWADRDALRDSVERYMGEHPGSLSVALDVGGVDYVNSAGLGALFQLVRFVRSRGGDTALCDVSPRLARLFRTVGLHRLAPIHPNVQHAISAAGRSKPAESTERFVEPPPEEPAETDTTGTWI
jgi:anti-anti-sigma factor